MPMIKSDWRSRLTRGSLRGMEFLTERHDAKGGRRLVVHEFPGAEEPEVEDLGGKAWDWRLNCYFIGADYDLARDAFLKLLNTPGPTWLTHPWLGDLWVRARNWSVEESNERGGYCAITVEFAPGGATLRDGVTDVLDVAGARVGAFADAALDDFALVKMSAEGVAAFVAAVSSRLDRLRDALSLATLPLSWAAQIRGLVAGVKFDLAELIAVPGAYAVALRGLTDVIGGAAAGDAYYDTAGGLRTGAIAAQALLAVSSGSGASAAGAGEATVAPSVAAAAIGSAGGSNGAVQQAMPDDFSPADRWRLVTQLAVQARPSRVFAADGAAAAMASEVGGSAVLDPAAWKNLAAEEALRGRLLIAATARVALADYRAAAERDAVLACVVAGIDALLPAASDPVFQTAVSARTAVMDALNAQDLAPATRRDVLNRLPAVVLAHRLGVDVETFMARNGVRHPLFVRGRIYG